MTNIEMREFLDKVPQKIQDYWEGKNLNGETLKRLVEESYSTEKKLKRKIIVVWVFSIFAMALMVSAGMVFKNPSLKILGMIMAGSVILCMVYIAWMVVSLQKTRDRKVEIQTVFKNFTDFIKKLVPGKLLVDIQPEDLSDYSIYQGLYRLARDRVMASKAFEVTRLTLACTVEHVISSGEILQERSKLLDEAFQIAVEMQIVKDHIREILTRGSMMIPRH